MITEEERLEYGLSNIGKDSKIEDQHNALFEWRSEVWIDGKHPGAAFMIKREATAPVVDFEALKIIVNLRREKTDLEGRIFMLKEAIKSL